MRGSGREIMRHRWRKRIDDMYTGAESLLTLCEGNPRWLIGIFRPLIEGMEPAKGVGRPVQARSISVAIARYLSLLSTIPFPYQKRSLPVTKLIDRVGQFFSSDITKEKFKTEPALSLVVDNGVNDEELEAFGAAVNQGAFCIYSFPGERALRRGYPQQAVPHVLPFVSEV